MSHPERLGKYQITEVLGEGAMGVVYKGFDPDIRRTVAIKTIRQQLGNGSSNAGVTVAARFRNEAQAAGRLMHPGIVSVYEFGQDGEVAYIAMEFVEGQSLAHHLANKVRFTDDDIPGVMSQVLEALHHAHEQGVWHRDVKPANIIMSRNGRLKVTDFGIARIEDSALTQTSVMIGTPTYMAPEQFLGGAMDRRVDIYAAGVLLYLLLAGRPPFTGSQEQLLYKVVHETPAAPSSLEGVHRPRFYDAIVAKALAKKPEDRFANAADFKAAIEMGVGQPFDTTTWERTLISAPARPAGPTPPPATRGSGSGHLTPVPSHWDREVLAQAESSLARHVGPLAGVLVRRAARECADVGALYARLAEQVSNPEARHAFLEQATAATARSTGGGSASSGSGGTGLRGTATRAAFAPTAQARPATFDEALLEKAAILLARHVGPIAKVVVRKAAAASHSREDLFNRLGDAVPSEPGRRELLAELSQLS